MFKKFIFAFFFLLTFHSSFAQDDALSILNELNEKNISEPVIGTFKTTRVILSHSVETVKKHNLDFRVTHRFSDIAGKAGGTTTFFGFDNSSDIRTAFEYGVCDQLTVGIGRSKIGQTFDGHLKFRALVQTTDNKKPISITLFTSTALNTTPKISGDYRYNPYANRLSYAHQVIIARKFSSAFSLSLLPTLVHRNYVENPLDENDLYALGIAGRVKLTSRFAIVADGYLVSSKIRNPGTQNTYHPPLGLGIEIETGGHVFSLNFTNSAGIIENSFIPNTTSNWLKGEFRFGFNISRPFRVYRPKSESKIISTDKIKE